MSPFQGILISDIPLCPPHTNVLCVPGLEAATGVDTGDQVTAGAEGGIAGSQSRHGG